MSENQIGSLLMLIVAIPMLAFWIYSGIQHGRSVNKFWDEFQRQINNYVESLNKKEKK